MLRWRISLAALVLGGVLLGINSCRDREEKTVAVAVPLGLNEKLMRNISRLGAGYLVWERKSRTGVWEIWSKKLSGGKEKRLVPGERGKDHFCPKVSPDGSTLAFMSYKRGENTYPSFPKTTGRLWLMDMSTRKRFIAVPEARSYAEDRAVTWLDSRRICYIDAEGYTMEMNLVTKQKRRMVKEPQAEFGYLLSPDLRHATSGTPEFALYDEATQKISPQQRMGGCQPYFTQDGLWGYTMAGAGGPIHKMRLSTREISTVLEKNDPRLHAKKNYVYFPMISPCQRLLTFAASKDAHDHFNANYDIYVAHVHPEQLEIIGNPVRYTDYEGVDRFPDVFRKELPLGSHYVEGETELTFTVDNKHEWHWHISGGIDDDGVKMKQRFIQPGEYWVEATRNDVKLRGYVHVAPAVAPKVQGILPGGANQVLLHFDESVDSSEGRVLLESTRQPLEWLLGKDRFELAVTLPAAHQGKQRLLVEGFKDRAYKPNSMIPATVTVPASDWPGSEEGLNFVWENREGRNKLANGLPCTVIPHGLAYWDEQGTMQMQGGWFDAPNAGELVSSECRKTHEFSLEFVLTPQLPEQDSAPHRIFTIASSNSRQNVTLTQRGSQLEVWLRMSGDDPAQLRPTQIAALENQKNAHVLLTYGNDKLIVYVNGNRVWLRNKLKGDLSLWEDMHMRFGATIEGTEPWRGSIERVAIYNRILATEEITQHAHASAIAISKRMPPATWLVEAKLIESSPTPTLQEFQPYTEALVRHLYEVVQTKEGEPLDGKTILVSQWSWLGGQAMPAQSLKTGDTVTLRLNRSGDHPQVKNLFIKDELLSGFDADSFHDVSAWDLPLVKR